MGGQRSGLAIVFLATGLVTGVISALPSCDGPPGKTCFADRVNVLGVSEDAGPSKECTTCLQTRNAPHACCDAVGSCDDDPDKQCVPAFQATHRCVIEGGATAEPRCKSLLTNDRSKSLYSCMRTNCGRECGVPSCDLDPAVVLFENPTCDSCVGSACCDKINACYKDRTCKLVIECITEHCPNTLGPSMSAFGSAASDARSETSTAVCAGKPFPDGNIIPAHDCLQRCLDDFAPSGDAGTPDDQTARCLAFGVFACGAGASCGAACTGGPYNGNQPWPEDDLASADASARDAKGP